MQKFWWSAALLSIVTPAIAQEEASEEEEEVVTPEIYPNQDGSSGVYHARSAFTFPHPGAAFQGNDHFWGDDNFYSADGRAARGVETRDCLSVNILEGFDFTATSIFRSYKLTSTPDAFPPYATLGTTVPSIQEAFKLSHIAQDRSWAIGVEPFFEMEAVLNDFSYDLAHSPFGARILASRDFRYDKGLPLRLHANLGYRRDRSAAVIAKSIEEFNFTLPPFFPGDPALSTEEMYDLGLPRSPIEAALGLFRDDQVLVALAAEWVTPWVTPFFEYSAEFVRGVAPLSSPQRITLGARITPRPEYSDFALDLALDRRLSKDGQMPTTADPTVLGTVSIEPDLIFTVGVGWVFGHRQTMVTNVPVQLTPSGFQEPAIEANPPKEETAPTPPPNSRELRLDGVSFWIPTQSEAVCTFAQISVCAVRAPQASVPLIITVSAAGAKSAFSAVGPLGVPLQDKDAKATNIQGKAALVWQGKTASAMYWVARGTEGNANFELSLEGASESDWAAYSAALQ
jgi:hypothetical protein